MTDLASAHPSYGYPSSELFKLRYQHSYMLSGQTNNQFYPLGKILCLYFTVQLFELMLQGIKLLVVNLQLYVLEFNERVRSTNFNHLSCGTSIGAS